ncbi:M16 family metallopeptidase [Patescibacteria group bacterium]
MNFKPQIQTQKSGLRILTYNIPQSQSVTAMLLVKVGSRCESDQIAGISHFLEHLVSKGTRKYKTALDLAVKLDSVGAEHNAFTSKEYTGFYVKSATAHLALALDILSELVWQPLLRQEDIVKEKGVILEEIKMYNDMPMFKVARDFERLIFKDTNLGREVIGFKKSVINLKQKDFVDFRKIWYQPQNMVLGIVGGLPKKLPVIKTGSFNKNVKADFKKFTFSQKKQEVKIRYKKTQQAHFCLGFRALPKGHIDRYILAVLTTILGGNMSSRLFTEVRENRGLAYYIKSDISTYFDNGYFLTQAGVDTVKVDSSIKVILQELEKIKTGKNSISERELKRAKEYLKGKLALSLEDSKDVVSFFTEDMLLEDKIRTPKAIIKEVEKVTVSDLKRLAKAIFTKNFLNLAVIGPYKDKSKFEKYIKL